MFGYCVDVMSQIFTSLESTKESQSSEADACKSRAEALRAEAEAMRAEAEAMRAEAQALRAQVPGLRAQAAALYAKQEWTTESRTVTDPETGETTTETETVRDYAAEAANRAQASALEAQANQMEARAGELEAKAAELEAKATAYEAEATALDALASMLMAAAAAIASQITVFKNTQSIVEETISRVVGLLTEGTNIVSNVISNLDIPVDTFVGNWGSGIVEGVLNLVGIDLEDGLTDEVYKFSEGLVNTGAIAVKGFVSIAANAILGDGVLGQVGKTVINKLAGTVVDNIFDEQAVLATSNAIISGLGLIGVNLDTTGFNLNQAIMNGKVSGDITTFEEAKAEAKRLYVEYINQFNYTEEEKQNLIAKFNSQIDNAVVLSDEEFFKKSDILTEATKAFYNGPNEKIYLREQVATDVGTLIHEAGGHGTGGMIPSELQGYYIYDDETGTYTKYEGDFEQIPEGLMYISISDEEGISYWGIDEATTEYITREIYGETREDCAYNSSADALQKIVDDMTEHCGIDGEKLLYDTYTGEDKDLFKNKYNEIMQDEDAYDLLIDQMIGANYGDKGAEIMLDIITTTFEKKAKS